MARIDIRSNGGGGSVATGVLQLQGGVAMTSTLTAVTDQSNTASPLKLSTTAVQITSPLRITTSDASGFYLDAEDSATNNRFSIKRDPSAQEVTLDFASNPSGSTTLVGAIRTYRDGTNLSAAMSFIEDGSVGVGTSAPVGILHLYKSAAATRLAIDGDAGQNRLISYRTGAVQRFGLYVNNTAESGSNAGSNFAIRAYSDAGTLLSTPFFIERSTGNVGIGTTTPLAPIDSYVSGTGTGDFLLGKFGYQTAGNGRNVFVKIGAGSAQFDLNVEAGNPFFELRYGNSTTALGGGLAQRVRYDGVTAIPKNLVVGSGNTQTANMLQVIGSGSTSATTSLLVQNSAGTELFRVYDNTGIVGAGARFGDVIVGNYVFNGTNIREISVNANALVMQATQGTGVVIGNITLDASAFLQVNSTTKGFLPPRMTNAQRAAIGTPAVGLMVYCTDAVEGLYVYKSTGWTFVI
jgi:hypothetical protein